MDNYNFFMNLFRASTENDVEEVLKNNKDLLQWKPYGNHENNYSTIENQQGSPVAALVEKITNSIDAILMKKCLESGLDPKSKKSPRSIEEATKLFFPKRENWLDKNSESRREQARDIQIIADGPRKNTSLVIYDNGEGQHPQDFNNTLLSLSQGNKNEIHFVQGKYNMGGTGAICFCGDKRYQLIASRRYDAKGEMGFTLVKRHELQSEENRKNTWYEYFEIDGKIPTIKVQNDGIDLGLYDRKYKTGTIIKLYSYDLPAGVRSVISRDLNASLNEFLFEPALPIYTIDKEERYPKDHALKRHFFGLKRKLEEENSEYIYERFSVHCDDGELGKFHINVYIFNFKLPDRKPKEVKTTIRREFFKNQMSVLFSLNGQVQGSLSTEFISRSLDMSLLKDYLLIHVDCTNLAVNYRSELFMASRDRLKKGKAYEKLRNTLAHELKNSRLKSSYHNFKEMISNSSEGDGNILEMFQEKYKKQISSLQFIINSAQSSDVKNRNSRKSEQEKDNQSTARKSKTAFKPKRYPTKFDFDPKIKTENDRGIIQIPENGQKTINFLSDVESEYFDRTQDPGELEISIVARNHKSTLEDSNSHNHIENNSISKLFNVTKSSPNNEGKIKIDLKPKEELTSGNEVEVLFSLKGIDSEPLQQTCLIKIVDKQSPQTKNIPEKKETHSLPNLVQVWNEVPDHVKDGKSWDLLPMDWDENKVVHLLVEDSQLETVYINMDWIRLGELKKQQKDDNGMQVVEDKYLFQVYAHSIYLYYSNRTAKYNDFIKENTENKSEIEDYISDLLASHYAEFILNSSLNTALDFD